MSGPTGTNANKTLVLLNGRRLANHAFDAAAVDLNAIPLSAIERIEVLRDGASAIYGTDAIGGVINFITKRELVGFEISAQAAKPERSGGGDTKGSASPVDSARCPQQRFNVMASLDWRRQDVLAAARESSRKPASLGTPRGNHQWHQRHRVSGRPERFRADCSKLRSTRVHPAQHQSRQYRRLQQLPLRLQPRHRHPDRSEQITGLLRGSFAITPDHTFRWNI